MGSASSPAIAANDVATPEAHPAAHALITALINETRQVVLSGNTRSEANLANDRGVAEASLQLDHMQLLLKRPADREAALQRFMTEQQTLGSPNYHRWLSAQEFGDRYGVAQSDVATVTSWLAQKGFTVHQVNTARTLIDFSGRAELVKSAFGAEIHRLEVNGVRHIANMADPKIPEALAPVVAGIVSLHDFRPHTNFKPHPAYTYAGTSSTLHALVPEDLATIYNLNPLFAAGIKGQGQTIALVEDTNVHATTDVSTFRSTFGLGTASFTQVHPGGCTNPGAVAGNDGEATLDVEWAAAAAPAANLELVSCKDTATTFGGLIAIQNLINAASPPTIMSISYGECEAENGATANAAYVSTYQQAASEGVSVFVSSGDEGAASCDPNATKSTHGIGVSGFASTPYNVAVGGTDYSDTYAGTTGTYWNATNTAAYGSAKSYIPEIPWNDSCASQLIASHNGSTATYGTTGFCNVSAGANYLTTGSGSGGPSGCASGTASTTGVVSGTCAGTAKPSWQAGFLGNPSDGVRDIPDVSLFAANGVWGHYFVYCYTGTAANGGAACTGAPSGWSGAGGTSFSAPILAAIQALVNQKIGVATGNPNPIYYQLAKAEYGATGSSSCNSSNGNTVGSSCIFYDVTQGDMDVNCTGTHNCYRPTGTNGVLSTSNSAYSPAYGTGTGWDFSTGIGSINATNLVNGWPGATQTPDYALSESPSSLSETAGGSAVTTTVTVTPSGGFTGSVALSASGLPSGVTAAFSPASTTSTSTLTLTASTAAAAGTSTVTITGTSGTLTHTSTVSLTVTAAAQPDYTLSVSPATLSEAQGASATTTVAVTDVNGFTGSVALTASGLPAGVTAAFSPASTTSTSVLTLTASSTATTGTSTVTITGTSGALTHTTTVSLTVTATGGTVTQLLGNTGFETGTATPWTASSGVISNSTSEAPHAGSWDAWMNGYGSAHTDTLSQSFTIPAGKSAATLAFYLHIDSAETTTTTAYDTLKVQVLNSSGTVLATLATYSNLNKATGYVLRSFNLGAYIGQTVTLKFTGTEDSSLKTSFVVDDATVNVQ